jgi:hypothetical protein
MVSEMRHVAGKHDHAVGVGMLQQDEESSKGPRHCVRSGGNGSPGEDAARDAGR